LYSKKEFFGWLPHKQIERVIFHRSRFRIGSECKTEVLHSALAICDTLKQFNGQIFEIILPLNHLAEKLFNNFALIVLPSLQTGRSLFRKECSMELTKTASFAYFHRV
jgi:hypothetical protein